MRAPVGSDAELVELARRGDREAFAALVRRHRDVAHSVGRRLLGDRELAHEAVQEATLAALVGLDRLRSPERFGAWFCGIALNTARSRLRAARRSSTVALDSEPPDLAPGPAERAEAAEVAALVRRAVAHLAPGQRDAVLLFYLQGLTHREVAGELGITVNAVKARLHQARAALEPTLSPVDDRKERIPMAGETQLVDMRVVEIRRSDGDDQIGRPHVVVLQEEGGDRRLPIYIGPAEGTALALSLESVETPRPMTFQLAASLLAASGSSLSEVIITRLSEGTFFAVIVVESPGGRQEVDARPSDALNLALVTGAPIRVDPAVLGDPDVARHDDWQGYAVAGATIAAEVRDSQERWRR